MSTQHLITIVNTIGLNTWDFLMNNSALIIIISISATLTMVILNLGRFRKPSSHAANNHQHTKKFTDLYDRIHNFQSHQAAKTSSSTSSSHHNSTTDSNYHHAIKLLQRGIESKTLVEYCNLTLGEAELLQAIYGKSQ